MNIRVLSCQILVCLFSISVFQTFAIASPQTSDQAIKSFIDTVNSMKFPVVDPARHNELVQKAHAYLDLEKMGSEALSDHWATISEEEKNEFFNLMWKLIEKVAYPKNQNLIKDEQIVYGKPVAINNGYEVPVTIKKEDDAPAPSLSYHLTQKEGGWKIDDVILDDVSIIEDLKYQFNKIITESQFSGLLEKMRERLKKAEEIKE